MKKIIIILFIALAAGFNGLSQTLNDYLMIAGKNNSGLIATYKEYEAALEKISQLNTLPDPTFSFGYFISEGKSMPGMQQAMFSLNQMFPWFGTLKAKGDAAALTANAKFQSFINERNKLYFQVASAYFSLQELKEWIEIEQENILLLESYKNITTGKYENGSGTMVDILRVDIMLKDAQNNLNILREKEKPLLTGFNILLNRPENETVVLNDTLIIKDLPPDYSSRDSLITGNPDIKALELEYQAEKKTELAARRQAMPGLGLGLEYMIMNRPEDVAMSNYGRNVFAPMVSVSIPIFRSKYKASVKESKLMQESYLSRKEETVNRLIADYEMVKFEIQQQLRLLSLREEQIQLSGQSLNLLLNAYSNSGKEFEEVLRMHQQVLEYKKMRISALVQYHIARAKLNYLTSKEY